MSKSIYEEAVIDAQRQLDDANKRLAALLAEIEPLKQKRIQLEKFIAHAQPLLAGSNGSAAVKTPDRSRELIEQPGRRSEATEAVPVKETQDPEDPSHMWEWARDALRELGTDSPVRAIFDRVIAAGHRVNGKYQKENLRACMTRRDGVFARRAGKFGLVEWGETMK